MLKSRCGALAVALVAGMNLAGVTKAQLVADPEPSDLLAPLEGADPGAGALAVVRSRLVGVDPGQVDALAKGARVRIGFFADASFTARIVRSESTLAGPVWVGAIDGVEGGSLLITASGDAVTGNAFVPGRGVFQLRPLGDGRHAARQLDSAGFLPCGTDDDDHGAPLDLAAVAPPTREGGPSCGDPPGRIEMLVVYTEAARLANGGTPGIESLVAMCQAVTNQGYLNSLIQTRVDIVGAVEIVYEESGFAVVDRDRLTIPDDGYMDDVHDLRDQFSADVVTLITDTAVDACGVAHFSIQPGNNPIPSIAFNVCRDDCAVDNLTFPHELGHNQGCKHDRGANPVAGAFEYSHGYIEPGGTFRTIMGVLTEGVDRVQHFSNPDVTFGGLPTGVPIEDVDSAHNALTIDQTALNVANFRLSGTHDCNGNGTADHMDIASGSSADLDDNGVPDECELGVFFVDQSATGANDGSTWDDAFTSLHAALQATGDPCAGVSQIWVAAGTYRPGDAVGNRSAAFFMRPGISVFGGFDGTETEITQRDVVANETVLSGDLLGNDGPSFQNYNDNSFHVVVANFADSTAILDGFTITSGFTNGSPAAFSFGGGVLVRGGAPVIRHCTFVGNAATQGGGGAGITNGGAPTFINCSFFGNRSGSQNNGHGGAIYIALSEAVINGCSFSGNNANATGGAIAAIDSLLTIVNSTFSRNVAGLTGGVALTDSTADVDNSILWANVDSNGNGESAQISLISTIGQEIDVDHSCVMNLTTIQGEGNTDQDPQFIDPDGADGVFGTPDDNLRLGAGSPCIDSGSDDALPQDLTDTDFDDDHCDLHPQDIDVTARQQDDPNTPNQGLGGSHVDMGAFEVGDQPPDVSIPCPVDFNDDCFLNTSDILAFLNAYATFDPRVDFAEPFGIINSADILAYLNLFAVGCD